MDEKISNKCLIEALEQAKELAEVLNTTLEHAHKLETLVLDHEAGTDKTKDWIAAAADTLETAAAQLAKAVYLATPNFQFEEKL